MVADHQGCKYQAGVTPRYSVKPVPRMAAPDSNPTTLEIRYRRAYRNRGHAYRPPSLSSILPPRHHAARTPRASTALTPSTNHGGHPRSRGAPGRRQWPRRCAGAGRSPDQARRCATCALADSERLSASVRFRAVTGRPSRQLPRLGCARKRRCAPFAEGQLWNVRASASVCLDARELHHLPPFLGLFHDKLAEVAG